MCCSPWDVSESTELNQSGFHRLSLDSSETERVSTVSMAMVVQCEQGQPQMAAFRAGRLLGREAVPPGPSRNRPLRRERLCALTQWWSTLRVCLRNVQSTPLLFLGQHRQKAGSPNAWRAWRAMVRAWPLLKVEFEPPDLHP